VVEINISEGPCTFCVLTIVCCVVVWYVGMCPVVISVRAIDLITVYIVVGDCLCGYMFLL